MTRALLAVALLLGTAATAPAEIVDKSASGFTSRTVVTIAATPAQVYAMLGRVGEWWDPAHTYSGDATRLVLETRAGACFCETMPDGGSIQHGVVVYARPGQALRVNGALGPLQELGVTGSLTWALEGGAGGTTVTLTYAVGGYAPGGLDQLATIVDQVVGSQVTRMKAAIER